MAFLFVFLSGCTNYSKIDVSTENLVGIWMEKYPDLNSERIGYYYLADNGKMCWFASREFPQIDDFTEQYEISDCYKITSYDNVSKKLEGYFIEEGFMNKCFFEIINEKDISYLNIKDIASENTSYVKIDSESSIYSIYNSMYISLSKIQKLTVIDWIEKRYEYYDTIDGEYSGDKYTKEIFNEASELFNKTYDEIDAIWAESYYLKYE